MGKHQRARRAAAARARNASRSRDAHRRSDPTSGPADDRPVDPAERVRALLQVAAAAWASGDTTLVERAEIELCGRPPELVRPIAAAELLAAVADAWRSGWQPTELLRHVRRTGSPAAAALARTVVAADHAGHDPAGLDPRWATQIAAAELPTVTDPHGAAWLAAWATAAGAGVLTELGTVVETLHRLRWIPVLEELIPRPGGPVHRRPAPRPGATATEDPMLGKIRALLAKAESTTFEAEAEALTAKAQELMTRHSIDAAVVASGQATTGEAPIAVRVPIDDPYVDAKSLLLHVVAKAGRCQAVSFAEIGATTVVGFATEVAGVELLYTSLLVQAQTSLNQAARTLPAGARQRSRSFRSSFLLAYAQRIGERLASVQAEVIAETEAATGRSVLPALLSREVAVDEAVAQRYGPLESRRIRGGSDPAGWASGRRAADTATIVGGALPGA